jgi:hypothetical protein
MLQNKMKRPILANRYLPARKADAINNVSGTIIPLSSQLAANTDKYQLKTMKQPALNSVKKEADI